MLLIHSVSLERDARSARVLSPRSSTRDSSFGNERPDAARLKKESASCISDNADTRVARVADDKGNRGDKLSVEAGEIMVFLFLSLLSLYREVSYCL